MNLVPTLRVGTQARTLRVRVRADAECRFTGSHAERGNQENGTKVMEAAAKKPVPINRWLPYWAVFQYDVGQTMRSWVYRIWVAAVLLATIGFLLYRVGLTQEAGWVQYASQQFSEALLRNARQWNQAPAIGEAMLYLARSEDRTKADGRAWLKAAREQLTMVPDQAMKTRLAAEMAAVETGLTHRDEGGGVAAARVAVERLQETPAILLHAPFLPARGNP